MNKFLNNLLFGLPKFMAIKTIRVYQKTFSPDHGPLRFLYPHGVCKFSPTCSEYTIQALNERGLFIGMLLGAKRLLRCHPFAQGGYDPVPHRHGTKKSRS